MAYGGGSWVTQNMVLPGTYINFISAAKVSAALSSRGIATLPLEMDWGPEQQMMTVERGDFETGSLSLFGYPYTADQLRPMREIFLHARTVHFFRLNAGGEKASCTYASARYPGTRGNDLKVVIEENEDSQPEARRYNVATYLGTTRVDFQQGVAQMADLADNPYLVFDREAELSATASTPLTGGTTGTAEDAAYQTYLDQAESYTFNAMGCPSTNPVIQKLFAAYCKRMREEVGKKFQVVCFRNLADHESVVSLKNGLAGDTENPALIPWVTGVEAGTAANASATALAYDGEYTPDTSYTQTQLAEGIREGSFLLHREDDAVLVLRDINSFVSFTEDKGEDFSSNQVIRSLDQIAIDTALAFNGRYIGKMLNDGSGRISFWNELISLHKKYERIRMLENFDSEQMAITRGETKKAVLLTEHVNIVTAMEQLYMAVYVH